MTIKSTQQKRSYGTSLPKYHQVSQQPLSNQGGMMQTLKESLVGGFGAGIGMNIADRAISSIFGGRKVEVQHTNVVSEQGCGDIINIYKNALSKGENIPQSLEEKYSKCIKDTSF
jgi:hypothetical protein